MFQKKIRPAKLNFILNDFWSSHYVPVEYADLIRHTRAKLDALRLRNRKSRYLSPELKATKDKFHRHIADWKVKAKQEMLAMGLIDEDTIDNIEQSQEEYFEIVRIMPKIKNEIDEYKKAKRTAKGSDKSYYNYKIEELTEVLSELKQIQQNNIDRLLYEWGKINERYYQGKTVRVLSPGLRTSPLV